MTPASLLSRIHAAAAVAIGLCVTAVLGLILLAACTRYIGQLLTLHETLATGAALYAEFENARNRSTEALRAVGATRMQVALMATPDYSEQAVANACRALAAALGANCSTVEQNLASGVVVYSADLAAVGDFADIVSQVNVTVLPPLTFSSVFIAQGDVEDTVSFRAVIAAPGATSAAR